MYTLLKLLKPKYSHAIIHFYCHYYSFFLNDDKNNHSIFGGRGNLVCFRIRMLLTACPVDYPQQGEKQMLRLKCGFAVTR